MALARQWHINRKLMKLGPIATFLEWNECPYWRASKSSFCSKSGSHLTWLGRFSANCLIGLGEIGYNFTFCMYITVLVSVECCTSGS